MAAAQDAPGNANVQGAAGLIALQARRLDLAEGLIARALELEPYSPKWANAAQRLRGLALAESAGVGR
jgi:Flp pilus assembly protein TadD